jgi:hypothetical protein
MDELKLVHFKNISLDDPFFDSLKGDYAEFPVWFKNKSEETAFAQFTEGELIGFLYPKLETEAVTDVLPQLPPARRIKIGTMKVDAHGTKLGERLLKKAFDSAVVQKAQELYITVFPKYASLISLLKEYGFVFTGTKKTKNGTEEVYVKSLASEKMAGDLYKDYPLVDLRNSKSYILSIKPEYHTRLFPDSILKTESYDLLSDVSHTNSIDKTYICAMEGVDSLKSGDNLLIYRTKDNMGSAEYRSVATSICSVVEMRPKGAFLSASEYLSFAEPYSVFNEKELLTWWGKPNVCVIKMLYNIAFTKKVIRRTLIENVGIQRDVYWGFLNISRDHLIKAAKLGGVNEGFIIS